MIPTIELDQETFRDIVEKAKKRIPVLQPAWTNFNENDSGIAFLELFAWLKEMQEFHLNQIGEAHRKAYLKILGMNQYGIRPGHTVVHCSHLEREIILPEGSPFAAGNIPFRSEKPVCLYPGRVKEIRSLNGEGTAVQARELTEERQKLNFPLFGPEPAAGASAELLLSQPLTAGREYGFFCYIKEDYPIRRNPADRAFLPLAKVSVWYGDGRKKVPCRIVRDDTRAFVQKGILRIGIPEELPVIEADHCRIQIRLEKEEYDAAPVLEYLDVNPVELVQRRTVTECGTGFCPDASFRYRKTEQGYKPAGEEAQREDDFWIRAVSGEEDAVLGTGTGFPGQVYETGFHGLLRESVEILAESPEYPGYFERWERVEDFWKSGPEDRHFVVEEPDRIVFGDNRNGMAPEGLILLAAAGQSEGILGNVKKGQIHPEEQTGSGLSFQAVNEENVLDGRRAETIEECLERFQRELKENEYAVTAEDYERIVYQTPGLMIEKAKLVEADPVNNRVSLAVKTWTNRPGRTLGRAARETILHHMERYRMIGTDVQVLEPDVIRVNLYLDLELLAYYRDAGQEIEERLRQFFEREQSDFGKPVLYSALYGFVDGMECVRAVRSMTIDAGGPGVERNRNNDVILPPNGLAELDRIQYSVSYTG